MKCQMGTKPRLAKTDPSSRGEAAYIYSEGIDALIILSMRYQHRSMSKMRCRFKNTSTNYRKQDCNNRILTDEPIEKADKIVAMDDGKVVMLSTKNSLKSRNST